MLIARTVAMGRSFALIQTGALATLPKRTESGGVVKRPGSGWIFLTWGNGVANHNHFSVYQGRRLQFFGHYYQLTCVSFKPL